jgi:hypothetical protein
MCQVIKFNHRGFGARILVKSNVWRMSALLFEVVPYNCFTDSGSG